jgi:hypothetical protein
MNVIGKDNLHSLVNTGFLVSKHHRLEEGLRHTEANTYDPSISMLKIEPETGPLPLAINHNNLSIRKFIALLNTEVIVAVCSS